jgi:hypothetical protein
MARVRGVEEQLEDCVKNDEMKSLKGHLGSFVSMNIINNFKETLTRRMEECENKVDAFRKTS